jgi:PAS domain S-box-containing protein
MNPVKPAQRYGHARQFLTGGFFLLALVVIMAVFFAGRERANHQAAEATLTATAQLTNLLSNIRETETGMRGVVLMDNAISLNTYNLAVAEMPKTLAALDAALARGHEADALPQIHQLVAAKMAELAGGMQIYQTGDQAKAVAQMNSDLNRRTMVELRTLVTALQAKEAQFLQDNEAEDKRNGLILQVATALAVAGTLLLGWFAIRDNAARTGELLAAEAALIRANEELEAKVAERTRTLQASEAQFRILAESLPGFVFMADAQGSKNYVNPQFTAYTGLTAAQVQGDGWARSLHPDDAGVCLANWKYCVSTRQTYEMEYRYRRHDGVFRWFMDRSAPIFRDNGSLIGWIGTATDIDERKQAEAAMADANAQLEETVAERSRALDRMFNLSTDILTICDFEGKFLRVSPAWERISGWPIDAAVTRPFAELLHPDDVPATLAKFEELKQGFPVVEFENRHLRADGSYCWLSWRAVPVVEEGRVYSVARDVTQERAREEQLRQSQKMEVVGQLTGGIAHDFNNLLTIIMGSLELLQRGMASAEPKVTRRLDAAMDGAKRAAALTHRLLAFARRQALEPTVMEPNRLLAGMADMLSRVLGENIALEFVHGAGLWRVQADVNQLENSILNLAVNARDAMPAGGHLTIETQNVYLDADYTAARPDVEPGQYVMIAVTDTGSGMTPDVVSKVFEPFFTTKPQGQGTGLGLAQVYGFIRQSQGHVTIYSEPGQGTSVKLYLPRVMQVPGAERAELPAAAATAGRGELILVVEDEENVRNFSTEVLEDAGYQVIAVENASAALVVLQTLPRLDMLFTDVVLTGTMNGRALADEVIRQRPETAVLFTTGYTRNAIVHHGRLDEGIDFIGKPFSATALAQLVGKILDRNRVKRGVLLER